MFNLLIRFNCLIRTVFVLFKWSRKSLLFNISSGLFLSPRVRAFTFILTLAFPCLCSQVLYQVCQGIQLFIHSMKFLCEVFYFVFATLIFFHILLMIFFLLFCLIHWHMPHLIKILNTHPSQ